METGGTFNRIMIDILIIRSDTNAFTKRHSIIKRKWAFLLHVFFIAPVFSSAQSNTPAGQPAAFTLQEAVEYAVKNQPRVQQALLDERITTLQIRSRLSDWWPQISFNYNL